MLEIRRYENRDHDAAWDLHNLALNVVRAHGGNGPWDDDLHHVEEVYLNGGGEFLVGELDGRVVAMGAIRRIDGETAEVTRMRVHPDHWRRGFGRAIYEKLEARAMELGCRKLILDTTTRQTAAQGFYRAHGFVETGRTRKGDFEIIRFEKRLG